VLAINPALEDSPELVNESPYQDGWLIKLKPTDLSEVDSLLSAADYQQLIG
jgi:glycine cleavage system H protein